MAITWTPTYTKAEFSGNALHVHGTLAGTGTYTTGGDTLSFASDFVKASSAPDEVCVWYKPTAAISANTEFVYGQATTIANGKLQLFSATGTEYSGSAPTTPIQFEAVWFNREV